jgi:arylsulfatase
MRNEWSAAEAFTSWPDLFSRKYIWCNNLVTMLDMLTMFGHHTKAVNGDDRRSVVSRSRYHKSTIQRTGAILFLLTMLAGTTASQTIKPSPRPNIILIMADDMGYSDIGSYGSEIPTPNLDRLAKNGVRLSQFYNTARCCPTRASLLTGLYPHQTGVGHMTEEPANPNFYNYGTPGYQGYLNRNCVTIAEVLKEAGYHTYMTGKWHLGMHGEEKWPLQRGFEKYYGILAGAASYFKPQGGRGLTYNNTKLPPPEGDYYTTDAFTDSAIAYIRGQQDDKPFFLYLAYNAPHWPLQAKSEDIKKFEGVYERGWDIVRQERYKKQRKMGIIDANTKLSERDPDVRAWDSLSKEEQKAVAYRMAVYAAQVSSIDQNIGKLLQLLEQQGKLSNTVIVFLSDNGACAEPYKELGGGAFADINNGARWDAVSYGTGWANASNTPFRKWKREMEEGGIATPLIVSWPQGIEKDRQNKIVSTPSSLIDVMPTFLALAGAHYPSSFEGNAIHPLEGRSMLPLLEGKSAAAAPYMFWEHENNNAVRKGNWKAVKDGQKGEWQLYNLETDRSEEHNLAGKQPDLLKELVTAWENWANSHAVFPKRKGGAKP